MERLWRPPRPRASLRPLPCAAPAPAAGLPLPNGATLPLPLSNSGGGVGAAALAAIERAKLDSADAVSHPLRARLPRGPLRRHGIANGERSDPPNPPVACGGGQGQFRAAAALAELQRVLAPQPPLPPPSLAPPTLPERLECFRRHGFVCVPRELEGPALARVVAAWEAAQAPHRRAGAPAPCPLGAPKPLPLPGLRLC